MKIAYVMDPMTTVHIDRDSTFALMLEAQARGHENYFLEPKDLFVREGLAYGRAKRVQVKRVQGEHYQFGAEEQLCLSDCGAVLMRKDPPFDMDYIFATYVLDNIKPTTYVMNSPAGIRNTNEKMGILPFTSITVPTFVSKDMKLLRGFLEELGGEMIVKPLDGCGGSGVFLIKKGDRNTNVILETMTDNGRRYLMAQRYIPEVRRGDKRIMLLDGEPMGAIWRIPTEEDNRGNMHVGGRVAKAEIEPSDWRIIKTLQPYLKQQGLAFVGIDVIGEYLTEINVTSPTGIQEIGRLDGTNPAGQTIDFIEKTVDKLAQ